MTLDDLIALIRQEWPARLERGRVTHIAVNNLTVSDGSVIHLRVLVQTVAEAKENR